MGNGMTSHIGNSNREERKPPPCRGKAGGGKHRAVFGGVKFLGASGVQPFTLHKEMYLNF